MAENDSPLKDSPLVESLFKGKVSLSPSENPYLTGTPIEDQNNFIGHQKFFQNLLRIVLRSTHSLILLQGQRLTGKTSVLYQIKRWLNSEDGFIPVYCSLENINFSSVDDILLGISRALAEVIDLSGPVRKDFDETEDFFRQTYLPQAVYNAGDSEIVLLLDEVDVIDSPYVERVYQQFIQYLQEMVVDFDGIRVILTIGRQPGELAGIAIDGAENVNLARLPLMGKRETRSAVIQSEVAGIIRWSDSAVKRIWDLTRGHPFLVQQLCSVVWENAVAKHGSRGAIIQVPDIKISIDQIFRQATTSLQWIWNGF